MPDNIEARRAAIIRVYESAQRYFAGDETAEVLAAYENAAFREGIPWHIVWDVMCAARPSGLGLHLVGLPSSPENAADHEELQND